MDEYKELKPREKPNISNMESFSKNISNFGEIKADSFEDNLNISDIMEENRKMQQNENSQNKKYINSNIYKDINIKDDFSEDLDNIKEDEFNQRKISLCSLQSEEYYKDLNNANNKKTLLIDKKETKKITKEDLNNIPLPVFSCIYCSNDIIAFKHLMQEIITNKYLFQTSVYDLRDISKLIRCQPLIDKDDKNEKLLNIIIKNTEYIKTNYNYEKIRTFFKSQNYIELCQKELMNNKKYFTQRIEESIVKKKKDFYFKGINKIPKNSQNNKCLFNSTNSLINNYNSLSGFVETIPTNNNMNLGKNNNTNNTNFSNISINFNSISLNNNETGNYTVKDNNNLLVSIVEHIENNIECTNEIDDKEEIMDFFDLDIKRKITKENIIWENNYYDIWNPVISDDDDIEENNDFSSTIRNETGISRRNKYIKRKKILGKFRKYNLSNIKSNESHHEKEYTSELSEKDYKLKVNLLKSNSQLKSKTSNNSFNYKANKILSVSQMKSMGSTNNSTVINFDNNEKLIKSNIISHMKDFNTINNTKNESRIAIYVNTLNMGEVSQKSEHKNKKNISMNIGGTTSLKSKNILNQTLNNQFKIYRSFINSSNIFNLNRTKYKSKNVINKKGINSNSTSFNKSNNNLSISKLMNKSKFLKNKSKIEKLKNKKIWDTKKIRCNDTNKKLRSFNTLNSYLSNTTKHKSNQSKNNIAPMNKTISNTNNNTSNNISLTGRNKIISTRIIFKQKYNNKSSFINNNNCKKTVQFKNITSTNNNNSNSKKYNLSHCSFNKSCEKISIEKIRKKIAEIAKIINNKNLKGYHLKNKANTNITGIFNTNQNAKINKNRNKAMELFPKNNNGNVNNNNNKINSERKSFINSNKKLMLSSSFVNKPKVRIVDKNNIKRFINFNK